MFTSTPAGMTTVFWVEPFAVASTGLSSLARTSLSPPGGCAGVVTGEVNRTCINCEYMPPGRKPVPRSAPAGAAVPARRSCAFSDVMTANATMKEEVRRTIDREYKRAFARPHALPPYGSFAARPDPGPGPAVAER